MLLIKTKIGPSPIHGIGLFSDEFVPRGTLLWRFTPCFDLKFTREQILDFPEILQIYLYRHSWKSKDTSLYIFSSDDAKYFNHSLAPNTISLHRDDEEEVITIATRDIQIGEELTDNYFSEADHGDGNVLEEIAKKYNLPDRLDFYSKDAV